MGILGFGKDKELVREQTIMKQQKMDQQELAALTNATHPQNEYVQMERQKEREDLVRWQEDLEPEIKQLIYDLRQWEFNEEKNGYGPVKNANLLCNEKCIRMIRAAVRPLMGKNIMLANLTEERILQILRSTIKTIARNICILHDQYQISFHNISHIRQTVQNAILPGPYRAMNNGERNYLTTISKRIEQLMEQQKQKSGGVLDFLHPTK